MTGAPRLRERGLRGEKDARVRLHGDKINETLQVPAVQQRRERKMAHRLYSYAKGGRDAGQGGNPKRQRTGSDFTAQKLKAVMFR